MKIYVFNFAINTQDDQFHLNFSCQQKLDLVKKQLEYIQKVLEKPEYACSANQSIRAIFVAPEYFFARSYPEYYLFQNIVIPAERGGRHYPYTDYEEIRRGLTQLSTSFRKILIVPGTVAWKQPVVKSREIADLISEKNSYAPVPTWVPGARKNSRSDYDDWMQSIGESPTEENWRRYYQETPDSLTLKAETLLRKDAGDFYGGAGAQDSLERKKRIVGQRFIDPEEYIRDLQKMDFGLAYNTAFFYLGGKKIAEYSKHSDYQEILFEDAYKELSVALLSDGCSVLKIAELTFGIEICLDHACDILGTYLSRSNVFLTVGNKHNYPNLGSYYLTHWDDQHQEIAENHLLKDSVDAYYRFRSLDGTDSKLYYFSRKSVPFEITDLNLICTFDDAVGVSYDNSGNLLVNGTKFANLTSHKETLTAKKSLELASHLSINRDWKPNIHLVLSACVRFQESQATDLFIHSSSELSFNEPKNRTTRINGYTFDSDIVELGVQADATQSLEISASNSCIGRTLLFLKNCMCPCFKKQNSQQSATEGSRNRSYAPLG